MRAGRLSQRLLVASVELLLCLAVTSAAPPEFDSCDLSFAEFDRRVYLQLLPRSHYLLVSMALVTVAALCPPRCVSNSSGAAPPRVYGSYPYHNASSICAAAVHAGVITDEH